MLAATDVDTRARRLFTLATVVDLNPLPVDSAVAQAWARLRVERTGQRRRVDVNDTWIAATALALDVAVVTQDRDFDVLADVSGLRVSCV